MLVAMVAAGGTGSRMAPATKFINKHLLPCGKGKLMIDFPLNHLKELGFKQIQIVTGSVHAGQISEYVGDGEAHGFEQVEYRIQPKAAGIADCVRRAGPLKEDDQLLLLLGDNYFSKPQTSTGRSAIIKNTLSAQAWQYSLGDESKAKAFGQAQWDNSASRWRIIEKPQSPVGDKILTGMYCFPSDVTTVVETLKPSGRGELEVTDLLDYYAGHYRLKINEVEGDWVDLGVWEEWGKFVGDYTRGNL
jgi:glucose-1-phosphate thymidylyltransferase